MASKKGISGLAAVLSAVVLAPVAVGGFASIASAEPLKVSLDWAWRPYHAPFILAEGKGYYKDAGLDVEMEQGRGSKNTALMVSQGNYDIGHLNVTNAAHAIAKGVPLHVVGVYQHKTAASFIGLAEKVDFSNGVESLKKYRIGSTPGGSDQLSLSIFKAANNLSDSDLNVVSLDGNTKTAALLAGEIDVVSGDSYAYKAIVKGAGGNPVALQLADFGVPLLGFGFAVNKEFEKDNGDKIRTFLEVTKRAFAEVAADPDGACTYIRTQKEIPGSQQQCVDYVTNLLDLSQDPKSADWGHQTREEWVALLGTLEKVGEIDGGYDVDAFFTNAYVPN
ncbi:ABC transporter substrate-binding protein [Futiania mangrovi]|uniref:Thiamine pyrimidine synthase n=1 Tax=Futiania mangrovi TaxID=2959716 RepID=A0A9J6PKN4_9PROT|nr:ABC transporter substrate-binding protein [Futiania mangrovii]MCP1337143.1 ABC transporter substrate-binding protein [Futiania mangrovii]